MLKAGKAQAAWTMQLDLRRVGLGVGWTLLAVSLLMIVTMYALTLSHPGWKDTPVLTLNIAVGASLLGSSVFVLALTYAVKAVADSVDSYQAGMQDLVGVLAKAIPQAEETPNAEVYDIGTGRGRRRMHTMS